MGRSREVVIAAICRTALGSFGGGLNAIGATDLGGLAIKEAVRRAGIEPAMVEEVFMSQVLPCGYGQNPARQAMLKAQLPVETAAVTINKVCGGGLMALAIADRTIQAGDAEIVVAGGMESMSNAPFYLDRARFGYRMGNAKLLDHMVHDGLWDVVNDFHMGISNDLISQKYEISREEQDRFAAMSYARAMESIQTGRFRDEIFPVAVPSRKGDPVQFDTDECPKPTPYEVLAKMKPAFQKEGFATAGNSSVISDGAAAAVIMSGEKARELGISPLARIMANASAGVDLKYVLYAPVYSIPKALKKAGMSLDQIELHEINEAFSGSTTAVLKGLGLGTENVNVNGGSVALGHPIGASGCRIMATLVYEMRRRGLKFGEASLCLGGGESVTMIIESL